MADAVEADAPVADVADDVAAAPQTDADVVPESGVAVEGADAAAEADEDDVVVSKKRPMDEGDAAQDEEESARDDQAATPKKKKKGGKKSARDERDDDRRSPPAEEMESEQTRRRKELAERINAAAKGPRRPKKKRADETDLEQAADEEVLQMREKMLAAATADQEANVEHRPATAKLRLLKEAVEALQKTNYQQAILDNNLLEAVRAWLEPLPDKSLPSLNIQRALFPLLEAMYIDTVSLKMSGLGKLMLFYTKRKGVDKTIQRIADRLIESWSRPILKRSSSYRDRQQAIREVSKKGQLRLTAAQVQKAAQAAASQSSQRARIPESVTGNAFRFAPQSQVGDSMDESQLSKLAERQRINKFKRSMQAAKR